jgi:hypothetical protein
MRGFGRKILGKVHIGSLPEGHRTESPGR